MRELSIEKMEMVSGGKNAVGCAAGIITMAAIAGYAFVNPVGFGVTLLYCAYSGVLASTTGAAALAIMEAC